MQNQNTTTKYKIKFCSRWDRDWKENDFSVKEGFTIFSAYKTSKGEKLWVITEADRSSSTVLLPSE